MLHQNEQFIRNYGTSLKKDSQVVNEIKHLENLGSLFQVSLKI